ncbi:RNA 2',3'-cyclic phosphodiesterase [Pontibaca salina]|uniref:RNA 2',3'-cyclic phosphodiesterase n=1 Tax=Pontibaca salina TaxID=2795731 RepID=A0A934HK75_9RHOB|nr:RNA 2',3'-cyclic phosphodiesterase [Pontibaca salina]MBI6629704.1 RNA 2',3'-cyclic phosphodiesterase [Pontibaca salina]
MRSFVAITPPDMVREALLRVQETLPIGRPVPGENLHLTLAFLDDQPEQLLRDLHEELAEVPAGAFDLELAGLGAFGGAAPRILFAQVGPSDALDRLHRAVVAAARRVGISLPRERFRPHITLIRFPGRLSSLSQRQLRGFLDTHATTQLPGFTVQDFTLFHSTLHRGGARHEELASYDLREIPLTI